MSASVIDDPTVLGTSEPQRLSAVSSFVKLILGFGFLWGLIVGIVGQFIFRGMLEQELIINQTLSIEVSQRIIFMELIYVSVALIIACIVLGIVWKAPSRKAAVLTSMSVGFIFALSCHMFFAGSVNGAIYNRDVWSFLHQNFSSDDRPFLMILATGVVRTVQEGMAFSVIMALLLSAIGAVAGLFLRLDSNPIRRPGRYVFGSVAALVFPTVLLATVGTQVVTYEAIIRAINNITPHTGETVPTDLLMPSIILPPLLAGIVSLIVAILWAWRLDLATVHRPMLRLSQILVAITGGIIIIGQSQSIGLNTWGMTDSSPSELLGTVNLWDNIVARTIILGIVALSWMYAIVLQVRLQNDVQKAHHEGRVSDFGLAFAGLAVFIIAFLLMDFLSTKTTLNLVLYPVSLIPDALQDTLDPSARVRELLYTAITGFWVNIGVWQVIGLAALISFAIYQPIAWLANKFER